jgi:O-antigen/teichoic acid export membrane protein
MISRRPLFQPTSTKLTNFLFKPAPVALLTNLAIMGANLIAGVAIARALGPVDRGYTTITLLWPLIAMYLTSFGLPETAIFFVSRSPSHIGHILGSIFFIICGITILFTIPIYIVMPIILSNTPPTIAKLTTVYAVSLLPLGLLGSTLSRILQGQQRFWSFNLARLIIPFGSLVLYLTLIWHNSLTVSTIVSSQIALQALNCTILTILVFQNLRMSTLHLNKSLTLEMLRYGAKVQVGTIGQIANLRIDQLILSLTSPASQLGLYAAAASAVSVLQTLPNAVRLSSTPELAKISDPTVRCLRSSIIFRRFLLLWVPACLLFTIALPLTIPLIYSSAFRDSVPLASILAVAVAWLGLKEVLGAIANGSGLPWLSSQAELIGIIVLIPLLLVLTSQHGAVGAAGAAAISGFVSALSLALMLIVKQELRLRIERAPVTSTAS